MSLFNMSFAQTYDKNNINYQGKSKIQNPHSKKLFSCTKIYYVLKL